MVQTKSEFGRGLVICLCKFSEHLERFYDWEERFNIINGRILGDAYQDHCSDRSKSLNESMQVELFFNGASDHLYDIQVPKKWKGTQIDKKVKELQRRGLEIGHGFTGKKMVEERCR